MDAISPSGRIIPLGHRSARRDDASRGRRGRRCRLVKAFPARLRHPDLDARAAGQAPAVSWIEDGNTVYARLGQASPSVEVTLVDPDGLLAGRRARLGDPETSTRDYRSTATDHRPDHPHELSRLSNSWCHVCECDPGRAPSRRRRSGRGRAQEEKDPSDRDGNAEPHEATLNHLASSVKLRKRLLLSSTAGSSSRHDL